MTFLEDSKLNTSRRVGITSLLSNITQKPGSHKGGWTRLLKCQLRNMGFESVTILKNGCDLNKFDYIIFDLGAEYSGTLNLFGGLDEKCRNRVCELLKFEGKLFSWRNQLPDLVGCIKSRLLNKSTHPMFATLSLESLTDLGNKLSQTVVFDHAYRTNKLLIGDSHTPSVWDPSYMIERRDGRTLKGMLENQTINRRLFFLQQAGLQINHLMVHCSSIDIRHHIARESNPEQYTYEVAKILCDTIATFGFTSVKLAETVGIEDESRELPKTGYFKGTPFFGSWEQRNRLREIFNAALRVKGGERGMEVLEYPKYFFDESGKVRFDCMEVPGSVHTSPEHYKWDLDKNQLRWTVSHDAERRSHYATLNLAGKIEKDMYGS